MIAIIAKNRNGPVGELVFKTNEFLTRIYEEEEIPEISRETTKTSLPSRSFSESVNNFEEDKPF